MCAGHNTAAVVWLSVGQSRREMYAVSHLLLGGAVRGRHGRLWPEDQQRELDEMSADVKGDVRRPEQQAKRLLSVGGGVSSLHGVDETQWWRYSQVVMMITASVSEKMWKLSHCRNSAKKPASWHKNFTEIGQSAAELWPKNDFQHGSLPLSWVLNKFYVWSCHS